MTCIVGLVENGYGRILMGGDSAGVSGYDLNVRADQKVFVNGEFLFGFTTSFRMGQLLRYKFAPPPFFENEDLMTYASTRFVDAIRQTMKDGGFNKIDNGRDEGGTFLVGFRGRLFCVHDDYQVGEAVEGFQAVSCGDQIAHGALFATKGTAMTAKERITTALEAAHRFSAGVRPPFLILEVPEKGKKP